HHGTLRNQSKSVSLKRSPSKAIKGALSWCRIVDGSCCPSFLSTVSRSPPPSPIPRSTAQPRSSRLALAS
ncbi:hypothetical protein BKA62DRAFT_752783, partial [Auriculariales sp. MPI-PUGE-AT-0066]